MIGMSFRIQVFNFLEYCRFAHWIQDFSHLSFKLNSFWVVVRDLRFEVVITFSGRSIYLFKVRD